MTKDEEISYLRNRCRELFQRWTDEQRTSSFIWTKLRELEAERRDQTEEALKWRLKWF